MGWIGDLLAAWDRLKSVKALSAMPAEVAALRSEVARLGEALASLRKELEEPCPPECCDLCGAKAARLLDRVQMGMTKDGILREDWMCLECSEEFPRFVRVPEARPARGT